MGTPKPAEDRDRTYTVAEYQTLPEEDGYRVELVRGRLVREPSPGPMHGRIEIRLGHILESYAEKTGAVTVFANTGFVLEERPATVRGPDVAVVAKHRVPASGYSAGYWRMAPDLAIEILSPSNRAGLVREKAEQYIEAGAHAVWVVDPRGRSVTVHQPELEPKRFDATDMLEQPDILPGFQLHLSHLFTI